MPAMDPAPLSSFMRTDTGTVATVLHSELKGAQQRSAELDSRALVALAVARAINDRDHSGITWGEVVWKVGEQRSPTAEVITLLIDSDNPLVFGLTEFLLTNYDRPVSDVGFVMSRQKGIDAARQWWKREMAALTAIPLTPSPRDARTLDQFSDHELIEELKRRGIS